MAQKYNPSTGQWEEEEEDEGSLTGGTAAAFGGGSSPALLGTSMAPGIEDPGFFQGPNGLAPGYGWEAPSGSTKSYKDPWDTSFDYLGADGTSLGRGYDTYEDAIRKLSFTSGAKYYDPVAESTSMDFSGEQPGTRVVPGSSGGWGFSSNYIPAASGGNEQGDWSTPEQLGQLFNTKEELYNHLLSQPGSPLTYESREKYGRALTEGQLQNMYAQYAGGGATGAVPDWTYHRAAYPGIGGGSVSGDAALVGSTPLFGSDGKILGYKSTLNPEHIRVADTSGRVRSSTWGGTNYSPEVEQLMRRVDDNTAFINASDKDKYGYNSSSANSYDKADSSFSKFLKVAAPLALAAFIGPQIFAGMGGAGAGAAAGVGAAEAGSIAAQWASLAGTPTLTMGGSLAAGGAGAFASELGFAGLGDAVASGGSLSNLFGETAGQGFSSAEGLSQSLSSPFGGGGIGSGVGGLGLEGAPGIISDLGALFGDASAIGGADASAFGNFGDVINGLDPSAYGGANYTPSLGDMASPTMDAGTSSLSDFAPESLGADSFTNKFTLENIANGGQGIKAGGGGYMGMSGDVAGLGSVSPSGVTSSAATGGSGYSTLGDKLGYFARNNLGLDSNLVEGGRKMYNFMTNPMGSKGTPSPLSALYKGGKAFMDYKSNQDAMDMYKKQMALAQAGADPNRGRGNYANEAWQQNFQDPMAGYKDFMMGGGRDFIDQARAQAARSGRRGSYINSGKMNSDLASMYMKQQLARGQGLAQGFERPDNTQAQMLQSMGPLMNMERNKYAPFGQAIDYLGKADDLSSLFDSVKGWF